MVELFREAVILAIALFLTVAFSGCAPEIRYVPVELTHEPRPILPRITEKELECLGKQTNQKLYDLQRLLKGYAITLETIIDSTKPTKTGE